MQLSNDLLRYTKPLYIRLLFTILVAAIGFYIKSSFGIFVLLELSFGLMSEEQKEATKTGLISGVLFVLIQYVLRLISVPFEGSLVSFAVSIISFAIMGVLISLFGYYLKDYNLRIVIFSVFFACGIPLWLFSPLNKSLKFSYCFLFVLSFLFKIKINMKNNKLFFSLLIGLLCGYIVKLSIDFQKDPSSHNLLPFEIIMLLFVCAIIILVGIGLGLLYNRLNPEQVDHTDTI